MKHVALIALVLFAQSAISQEISNGGFEIWGLNANSALAPDGWLTSNNEVYQGVTQDTAAFSGDYAMKVKVLPGFEGGIQQIATANIPSQYIPYGLSFMVKTNIPDIDEYDNAAVITEFRFEGETVHTELHVIYETIEEWEQHIVEYPLIDIAIDEIRIHVSAGYIYTLSGGSWETWISVDDMMFMQAATIGNSAEISFSVYPNPAGEFIRIQSGKSFQNATYRILDRSGRIVQSGIATPTVEINRLESGLYYIEIIENGLSAGIRKILIL